MRIAFFNTKQYDREFFTQANATFAHKINFLHPHLSEETAVLAEGYPAVSAFVNDVLDKKSLRGLADNGVKLIALRCAGFNNLDVPAARDLGLTVVRVPAYSPYAVAEHAVGLILALNRRLIRASARVHDGNFALDGLLGFDLNSRVVGLIGTGAIGAVLARIMLGFGCRVLAYDVQVNQDCAAMGVEYVPLSELLAKSDIVSLHCPLTPETRHLIDKDAIAGMKPGVMLINTSRGALLDTRAVISGLKSGRIGYLGLDVYEEEGDLFFEDLSGQVLHDDIFARLLTFPNVLITGHQAFFTADALKRIAETTLTSISQFERDGVTDPRNTLVSHPRPVPTP